MSLSRDRTSFRQLFEDLRSACEYEARDVLWLWLDDARSLLDPLRKYGSWGTREWSYRREEGKHDMEVVGDVYRFYALSRVSDFLLLPFQHGPYAGSWPEPAIGLDERTAFFEALGLQRIARQDFHPFFHEIVSVDRADDPTTPISVVEEIWPGFMLDHLLICRAGVRVLGGEDYIVKEVAESSTLYWAYLRRNRRSQDLSHGGGSFSQWGTDFRRDYTDGMTIAYNVDGFLDARLPDKRRRPNRDREELEPSERVELLVHRCFVRTSKPHEDRWPYYDTLTVSG